MDANDIIEQSDISKDENEKWKVLEARKNKEECLWITVSLLSSI